MKISAKVRKKLILQELIRSTTPISADQLAAQFSLKKRMILYDIESLNEELHEFDVQIQNKSKQGYYILQPQKAKVPIGFFQEESYSSDLKDMETEIFFTLLFSEESLASEVFTSKFHLSASSIHRILSNMSILETTAIKVEAVKFQGFYLVGEISSQLMFAITLLTDRFSNYYSIEDFYSLLPVVVRNRMSCENMKKLDELIRIQNQHHDVWLTNKQHQWILFCWVATILYPDKKDLEVEGFSLSYEHRRYIDYTLNGLALRFSSNKYALIAKLLDENSAIFKKDLHQSEAKRFIQYMIEKMEDKDEYDIVKLAFDLYPHITQTVFRETNHIDEELNPLVKHISTKYSKEYKVAQGMGRSLEEISGIRSSETHLSYFAMYLFKNRKDNHYRKLRVVLICATGRGFSNLMQARLLNRFPNMDIVKTMSAYHYSALDQLEDIDLIISTNPLKVKDLPILVVTPILGNSDLDKIRRYLDEGDVLTHSQERRLSDGSMSNEMSLADLPNYSLTIAKITVQLLDSLTDFIDEYDIPHDHLLGLTIHLLMAVERWYSHDEELFEDAKEQYELFSQQHPRLTVALDDFFLEVENQLKCHINYSERIAFFHYIF